MCKIIAILFLFIVITRLSGAQALIELKDVKKINLNEYEDGVAGFWFTRNYEIIHKHNKWICYQTKQEYQPPHYIKRDKHINAFRIQHTFVKEVSVNLIKTLLNSASVINPHFNWEIFNIKPLYLQKEMVGYYKFWNKYPLKPDKLKTILALYENPINIKAAIDEVQKISPVDAVTGCTINIIKRNNDTVKIQTEHMRPYMQPWQINGHDSYDLAINHFFVSVMNNNSISNKEFLTGKDMYNEIINQIEIQYNDQHPHNSSNE